jgi:hypothetical protein
VPLDNEVSMMTSSILRIFLKVLIEVGPRACIYRDMYACVFVRVSLCDVFRKEKKKYLVALNLS